MPMLSALLLVLYDPDICNMHCVSSLLCFIVLLSKLAAPTQHPLEHATIHDAQHLRLSAVVHSPHPPHDAKIECWQMNIPFTPYPTIGSSLTLANTTNLTYVSLPPNSSEGLHHPPAPMLFILLSGLAHVRLPADPSGDGLWIKSGDVIVATDTEGIGHYTDYFSDSEVVALQVPFRDGVAPEHTVLSSKPCSNVEET